MSNYRKQRRKERKKQLKINHQLKNKLYAGVFLAPCCYCRLVFMIDDLTIEHIRPLSFGGSNDPSNIDLACGPCNHKRGRESYFILKKKNNENQYHS